ncbi:ABC transporter substrate-binding protein [Frankia sp. CNm7]|uniref:ABC transporter substrate-binding protein n=1 Tax=Frankia nepalensis TaxID=1836974 RepID=A0A937UT25_9ACTN|nr:ABC transporter substrate-binding protein [Frankia nepalensis]MBL7497855.1 ABC transporter substrate-binding protein [Frankia nepalensis]MBL7509678.1 ABC transporter substrate-binding protein [Frankia nepalensis]MBL7520957.1 ABC transporter substrate-binding protein [Frankia nepalensis]MBL7630825.1 ABC transporter substrate-binding protein [Frankia nepalensis]
MSEQDSPQERTAPRYAERLFPAPVDHGIARSDRAVSTVERGTDTVTYNDPDGRWYEGGGRIGEKAVESIVVYPPTRGVVSQGDPFEPVKIGILVDMDLGQLLSDWVDSTILAVEDALNEGVYDRPVEIITADARGLPRENYLKVRRGYQKLVDDGCVVVLGPMISDNSLNLMDTANRTGVSCIGWTGSVKFAGDYCFTVANGDIPTESVMGANWCAQQGHTKVGFFWEKGSSGDTYSDYFRTAAQNVGVEIVKEVSLGPNPKNFQEHLETMRAQGAEAIVYMGYGYSTFRFAQAFKALDWDPPRFMGTAFMFYSNSNAWAEGLEGWHGVDQLGEDGANPNYEAMVRRFEARFGRVTRNVVVALGYDTARAAIHGIANATIPTPEEVRLGLEKIKWMPCTNGGPGAYITFAPYDHRGYKGDFLTIRELRGGELHFRGYYRPQWPSNTQSPLLAPQTKPDED